MTNSDYITCVEQYSDMVFRIAFSYFGNQADAEDLMQEVFLKILQAERVPETDEEKKAWVIRVSVNQCHSLFRAPFRKRNVWLTDYEWASFADDSSLEEDVTRRYSLYTAVMSLPDKCRIVVHLYYYEDLSIRSIADILDVKETTVQTRLARARARLKKALGDDFLE